MSDDTQQHQQEQQQQQQIKELQEGAADRLSSLLSHLMMNKYEKLGTPREVEEEFDNSTLLDGSCSFQSPTPSGNHRDLTVLETFDEEFEQKHVENIEKATDDSSTTDHLNNPETNDKTTFLKYSNSSIFTTIDQSDHARNLMTKSHVKHPKRTADMPLTISNATLVSTSVSLTSTNEAYVQALSSPTQPRPKISIESSENEQYQLDTLTRIRQECDTLASAIHRHPIWICDKPVNRHDSSSSMAEIDGDPMTKPWCIIASNPSKQDCPFDLHAFQKSLKRANLVMQFNPVSYRDTDAALAYRQGYSRLLTSYRKLVQTHASKRHTAGLRGAAPGQSEHLSQNLYLEPRMYYHVHHSQSVLIHGVLQANGFTLALPSSVIKSYKSTQIGRGSRIDQKYALKHSSAGIRTRSVPSKSSVVSPFSKALIPSNTKRSTDPNFRASSKQIANAKNILQPNVLSSGRTQKLKSVSARDTNRNSINLHTQNRSHSWGVHDSRDTSTGRYSSSSTKQLKENKPRHAPKSSITPHELGITEEKPWHLMWISVHMRNSEFHHMTRYQKVNQFPRTVELTRKDLLVKNIIKMQQQFGKQNFDILPETFVLPAEASNFNKACQSDPNTIWIVKPSGSAQGKGIYLTQCPNGYSEGGLPPPAQASSEQSISSSQNHQTNDYSVPGSHAFVRQKSENALENKSSQLTRVRTPSHPFAHAVAAAANGEDVDSPQFHTQRDHGAFNTNTRSATQKPQNALNTSLKVPPRSISKCSSRPDSEKFTQSANNGPSDPSDVSGVQPGDTCIVSKYIANPLLIDGFKFDCRVYVAVTSFDPLTIYIHRQGLARFATRPYSPAPSQLNDRFVHLTNYSINKRNADFIVGPRDPDGGSSLHSNDTNNIDTNQSDPTSDKNTNKSTRPIAADSNKTENKPNVQNKPSKESVDVVLGDGEGHKWTLHALFRRLSADGIDVDLLWSRVEDLVTKTMISVQPEIAAATEQHVPYPRDNCFQLFGFDVMFDHSLKPWLIEVNFAPSLGIDTPLDLNVKSHVIADTLSLAGFHAPSAVANNPETTGPEGISVNDFSTQPKECLARMNTLMTSNGLRYTVGLPVCAISPENAILDSGMWQFPSNLDNKNVSTNTKTKQHGMTSKLSTHHLPLAKKCRLPLSNDLKPGEAYMRSKSSLSSINRAQKYNTPKKRDIKSSEYSNRSSAKTNQKQLPSKTNSKSSSQTLPRQCFGEPSDPVSSTMSDTVDISTNSEYRCKTPTRKIAFESNNSDRLFDTPNKYSTNTPNSKSTNQTSKSQKSYSLSDSVHSRYFNLFRGFLKMDNPGLSLPDESSFPSSWNSWRQLALIYPAIFGRFCDTYKTLLPSCIREVRVSTKQGVNSRSSVSHPLLSSYIDGYLKYDGTTIWNSLNNIDLSIETHIIPIGIRQAILYALYVSSHERNEIVRQESEHARRGQFQRIYPTVYRNSFTEKRYFEDDLHRSLYSDCFVVYLLVCYQYQTLLRSIQTQTDMTETIKSFLETIPTKHSSLYIKQLNPIVQYLKTIVHQTENKDQSIWSIQSGAIWWTTYLQMHIDSFSEMQKISRCGTGMIRTIVSKRKTNENEARKLQQTFLDSNTSRSVRYFSGKRPSYFTMKDDKNMLTIRQNAKQYISSHSLSTKSYSSMTTASHVSNITTMRHIPLSVYFTPDNLHMAAVYQTHTSALHQSSK